MSGQTNSSLFLTSSFKEASKDSFEFFCVNLLLVHDFLQAVHVNINKNRLNSNKGPLLESDILTRIYFEIERQTWTDMNRNQNIQHVHFKGLFFSHCLEAY